MLEMLEPEVNPEEYSPITTPVMEAQQEEAQQEGAEQEEAQQVDSDSSSSSDSSTPSELSGLDVKQSFLKMIDQWQSHTPEVTNLWWKADDMGKVYDLMAAPWWHLVKQHSAIHSWSRNPEDNYNDSVLIYLHTTRVNFEQGCNRGDLGGRFVFKSPGQTLLHRT
eukprot:5212146-Amphidinium_carterae.1